MAAFPFKHRSIETLRLRDKIVIIEMEREIEKRKRTERMLTIGSEKKL